MNIGLGVANSKYTSNSQQIRVLTENWVSHEAFCPKCGSTFESYPNNKPVADFFCKKCHEDFELKSKANTIGNKINDGAYGTMLKRLNANDNPNFLLLSYDIGRRVNNFFVVPKYFFIPEIIERRKPLSASAKRYGWVGCNIVLRGIPESGKIYYVRDKCVQEKRGVMKNWKKTAFLKASDDIKERSWLLDIMACVDKFGNRPFDLSEIYGFEKTLATKHPNNKHIKDKIRQQLQILRDKGYLDFIARGIYKMS